MWQALAISIGKKLLGVAYRGGGRSYLKSKIDNPNSKIDDVIIAGLDSEFDYQEK